MIDANLILANVLAHFNQTLEAEALYLKVLQLDPEDAIAHYKLGNIYSSANRLREAERQYVRAIILDN